MLEQCPHLYLLCLSSAACSWGDSTAATPLCIGADTENGAPLLLVGWPTWGQWDLGTSIGKGGLSTAAETCPCWSGVSTVGALMWTGAF
jgi:hypothetical protein